ncbi:MAG: hypothetical protein CVU55_01800 [Deltaproteobacteria bacterium HGW-Deltaproteobacteria-13]|jgi:hypothetical protein|nr:MAG: hypothetical protein CVU55_01800 [Deltaproteobacteria bacterium HGW-Deltaproteobacteria-13]
MQNYEIKIDKDGLWYYNGAHMFRKEILNVFFQNLKMDECGKYLIELGGDCCYLDVEDTAFVVAAVYKTKLPGSGLEHIDILLNDDSREKLDVNFLQAGPDNVLYCQVKEGKFTARFSRKSYYQLAEFIEQSENGASYFINLNGEKYFINSDQAL